MCQEIGLAAYLDAQEPESHRQVSVGTATVVMQLNGLGFSNRRLYLVSQFFEHQPIEHRLGPGIHVPCSAIVLIHQDTNAERH